MALDLTQALDELALLTKGNRVRLDLFEGEDRSRVWSSCFSFISRETEDGESVIRV
jgi:hypothetical protein